MAVRSVDLGPPVPRAGFRVRELLDRERFLGPAFVTPALLLILVLVAYPFAMALYFALSNAFIGRPSHFVGIRKSELVTVGVPDADEADQPPAVVDRLGALDRHLGADRAALGVLEPHHRPDSRVVLVDGLLADLEGRGLAPQDQAWRGEDVEVPCPELRRRVVGRHGVLELAHWHYSSLARIVSRSDSGPER